jgi:hypothetical protein
VNTAVARLASLQIPSLIGVCDCIVLLMALHKQFAQKVPHKRRQHLIVGAEEAIAGTDRPTARDQATVLTLAMTKHPASAASTTPSHSRNFLKSYPRDEAVAPDHSI